MIPLLLLFLLSWSPAAFSQCDWTPRYSSPFRSTVFDVAVDNDHVWTATGYGVTLLDKATGAIRDSVAIPGSTRVIALNGTLAYAGSGSRLYVIRRNGSRLEVVRFIDAGATVNDIVVTPYLFVATANGLAHFDLVDPANPNRTGVELITTRPNVTSLALAGSTLYAADGDATVEVFTIGALPQKTGSIESHARSAAVHAATNNLIFVSDELGQNTDVISGTARLARMPYGTLSYAQLGPSSLFAAGLDRNLRALNLGNLTRVAELYEQQLAPTGGSNNRIYAMTRSGNTLYVAAGDMGLVTLDVTPLAAPHPLASYADGATHSAQVIGDKAYFTDGAGNIDEYLVDRTGLALTPARTWSAGASSLLRDQGTNALLTTSGNTAKTWSIDTVTNTSTITFAANITAAVLLPNNVVVARLADGSVWRAAPTPAKLGVPRTASLARAGNAVALMELTDEGKTVVRYYASADFAAPTRSVTLDGAAIGGIAMSSMSAAVFTFRGVNVIDLATGNVRVLPDSHRVVPRQLAFSANHLLLLGDRQLNVFDSGSGELLRHHLLPANGVALHAAPALAVVATNEGTLAVDYTRAASASQNLVSNRYYSKAAGAGQHLYLLDEGRVDIHWIGTGTAPRFVTSASAAGAIDLAALPQAFYTLAGNGTVTAWSTAGVATATATIADGIDTQPLAIHAAGNAIWVAISKGCSTGACEQKTLVLDPQSLAVATTLDGGAFDTATSGSRVYALFELPNQIRVYDVSSATQPAQLASATAPATTASIAFSGGSVYAGGDRIYAFNESLTAAGEFLSPSATLAHGLDIDENCAIVRGRSTSLEQYALPSWTAGTQIESPSNVRSVVVMPGRVYVLTDHSIEVWASGSTARPPRRRATR